MKERYKCHIFYSGDEQEAWDVLVETDKLPKNFEVLIVRSSPLLNGRVIMPFIEIRKVNEKSGDRLFGLDFIKKAVKRMNSGKRI